MAACACGCGETVSPGATWKRGHFRRGNSGNVTDITDISDINDEGDEDVILPDDDGYGPADDGAGEPLSLDEARRITPRDPDPARGKAGPAGDSKQVKVTAAVRRDIEGKLAFLFGLAADTWNLADPYCAGIFASNADEIARKTAPLICQSPDLVRWFSRSSNFIMWMELGIAVKPVVTAIVAHHVTKKVETGEAGEVRDADYSRYTAA